MVQRYRVVIGRDIFTFTAWPSMSRPGVNFASSVMSLITSASQRRLVL